MNPLQLPKVAKTLGANVKAVVATPKRIEGIVTASKDFLTGIPQGIAAVEKPEAPVQVGKSKGGKEKKEKKPKGGTADAVEDVPTTPVGAMVSDARAQLRDAEIDAAMKLLAEADASLNRLSSPISSAELADLYQTAALIHLVDGNATAATASVTQALVVDPVSKPNSSLGPEYSKLHKAISKSGVIHDVQVDLQGSGIGYISGRRVEGGQTIYVPAGKHLIQRKQGNAWVSEMIWIAEGDAIEI